MNFAKTLKISTHLYATTNMVDVLYTYICRYGCIDFYAFGGVFELIN